MPRHQAYQPHAGIASEVAASVFLFQQNNFPSGPRLGDIDRSTSIQVNLVIKWDKQLKDYNIKKVYIVDEYSITNKLKHLTISAKGLPFSRPRPFGSS